VDNVVSAAVVSGVDLRVRSIGALAYDIASPGIVSVLKP
jgi:hypothetical protein